MLRIALFLILIISSSSSRAADLPEVRQTVDNRLQELAKAQGVPGISWAVGVDGKLLFAAAWGDADVEHGTPVTTETRFRTASIAKSLTAVTILRLAELGKIDLDEDILNYCPEYGSKQWTITTRQLLGHLGGVRHYKSSQEASSTRHFFDLRSALDTFREDPLLHEPGSAYRYTTFGYNLLGSIAEGAGEESFSNLLKKHVLEPAEMQHTVVDDQLKIIQHRSRGYIRPNLQRVLQLRGVGYLKAGELYNASLHDTSMKIPGGGLLSTPSDLIRFANACRNETLLSAASCASMWQTQKTKDGESTRYGLGWRSETFGARQVVGHTGGQSGTSTVLLMSPSTGSSIAIMCNLQHTSLLGVARELLIAIDPILQQEQSETSADELGVLTRKLDSAIRAEVQAKEIPAFSIALVDDQQMTWARGYGFEDELKSRPASSKSVYRVGSVSKLFTDIAVMRLVETGELDLDLPIEEYLPNLSWTDQRARRITLRQLMTHRSGLVRESPVGNYFDPSEPSLLETIESLTNCKLTYPVDTKTKYSNAAVALVGSILEAGADKPHPAYVSENIFAPLKMPSSAFELTDSVENRLAVGWMHTYDGRRFVAPNFLLGTGPAGNLYSNVEDLSRFLSWIFRTSHDGGDEMHVISQTSLGQMLQPAVDAAGKKQGFGLGFRIGELDGKRLVGHGGAIYGYSTQLEALPDERLGVVAVSALDGSNGLVRRLTDYALRLMIAHKESKPLPDYVHAEELPPERTKRLVGRYQEVVPESNKPSKLIDVLTLNDRTYVYGDTLRRELATTKEQGEIVVDDCFGRGAAIELTSKGIRYGEREFVRLDDVPPPECHDSWRGLIGEYGWDHNTLYILERGGQLHALIEWFYDYPLTAIDENTFAFPDYGLYHGEKLHFTRDSDGSAIRVTAANVVFERRQVGTKDGETFKITPVRPIDSLRNEALAASPPAEEGRFRDAELTDVTTLEETIHLDIRYAGTNNFTGSQFYQSARAYMQEPAAAALARAHRDLRKHRLGVLVHDAYRPWHVTKMFWDATPSDMKDFVANPANGSRHNRGCAVDLTLYDLDTGKPIQMVAGYDEFSERSYPLYPGGTDRQRYFRDLLRRTMEKHEFTVYEFEWWHFDFKDWEAYRIGNKTFEEIASDDN